MEIVNVAGFVVCAVILAAALERYTPWATVLISLCTGAAVMIYLLPQIGIIAESVKNISDITGGSRTNIA